MNIYGYAHWFDLVKLNPFDHIDAVFADACQIVQRQLKLHKRQRHHLVDSYHFQRS
jgi:hypothetical protein